MGQRVTSRELNELRGRRWSAADARRVLGSWSASGLSMTGFGKKHGLDGQRLGWWKKRLADWGEDDGLGAVPSAPRLVPAVVHDSTAITTLAPVAIRLPAGIVLEVADTAAVAPAWIAAVVGALSRPA